MKSTSTNKFRRLLALMHSDRGTAAVSFILCFPIFLWIVAMMVQYALIVNGKLEVNHAAWVAARSAQTALPDEQPDAVLKATRMSLAPVSPRAVGVSSSEGQDIFAALNTLGANVGSTFADRYAYAEQATTVDYPQDDYANKLGQEVEVTVTYRMLLTVPGANTLIADYTGAVAGVNGKFLSISSKCKAQIENSRKTATDAQGQPNGSNMDGGTGSTSDNWDSGDDSAGWDANGGGDPNAPNGGVYAP